MKLLNWLFELKKYKVGKNIKVEDVNEFYYTYATSTNPSHFIRYHFYKKEEEYYFYYVKKQGDCFHYTQKDILAEGTVELTDLLWNQFVELLKDGSVIARQESNVSGGGGVSLFLYWKGDKKRYQQFTFASYQNLDRFVEMCEELQ